MSGVEVAGFILGAIPLGINALNYYLGYQGQQAISFVDVYSTPVTKFWGRAREYGLVIALLLHTVLPDALFVMDRVERYVLDAEDDQVLAFMNSYNQSFNMIGVAGAIVAQVAISAVSLTRLEDTHWTAEAFFVASLTTGALSVFFSCALNPAFHGLHSPEDIKDFLTKPTPASERVEFQEYVTNLVDRMGHEFRESTRERADRMISYLSHWRWKVPSAYAAIMLVAPMALLRVALNSFLIGLGIYLGKLYTANLLPSYGQGSLGILTFYIVSTVLGLYVYYFAQGLKKLEDAPLRQWRRWLDDFHKHSIEVETPNKPEGKRRKTNDSKNSEQREHTPDQRCSDAKKDRPDDTTPRMEGDTFVQSRHSRNGEKLRYTTDEDPERLQDTTSTENIMNLRQKSSSDETRLAHPPHSSLATSQAFDNNTTEEYDQKNIQTVLEAMLRAQKSSLQATEQLLQLHKK